MWLPSLSSADTILKNTEILKIFKNTKYTKILIYSARISKDVVHWKFQMPINITQM